MSGVRRSYVFAGPLECNETHKSHVWTNYGIDVGACKIVGRTQNEIPNRRNTLRYAAKSSVNERGYYSFHNRWLDDAKSPVPSERV